MPEQNEPHPVLTEEAGSILLFYKQTVAVAESVTGGHLQVAFSLAEKAGLFFQGGITTYNLGQKTKQLNVDPILAESCNSVSEEIAAQMAKNVCSLFCSDWGIAVTGYAAPIPEKNISQLFSCYAIYFRGKEMARQTIQAENKSSYQVNVYYTRQILSQFTEILVSNSFRQQDL